jgi:hypothetical protein
VLSFVEDMSVVAVRNSFNHLVTTSIAAQSSKDSSRSVSRETTAYLSTALRKSSARSVAFKRVDQELILEERLTKHRMRRGPARSTIKNQHLGALGNGARGRAELLVEYHAKLAEPRLSLLRASTRGLDDRTKLRMCQRKIICRMFALTRSTAEPTNVSSGGGAKADALAPDPPSVLRSAGSSSPSSHASSPSELEAAARRLLASASAL